MDNFVIVALGDKFHLGDASLGIFEVILFDATDNLLESVVHNCDHEIPLSFFQSSQSDCNALHVIVAGSANQQKHLSEDKLFIFLPRYSHDVRDDRV